MPVLGLILIIQPLDEQFYPSEPTPDRFASEPPSRETFDDMIVSDALAFDVILSPGIVPAPDIERQ